MPVRRDSPEETAAWLGGGLVLFGTKPPSSSTKNSTPSDTPVADQVVDPLEGVEGAEATDPLTLGLIACRRGATQATGVPWLGASGRYRCRIRRYLPSPSRHERNPRCHHPPATC